MKESLQNYAATGPRSQFIDIVRRFDEVGRDGPFTDDCCHLTSAGALIEARAVRDAMIQNRDLH